MTRISHSVPVIIEVNGKDQILSMVGDVVQGFEPATGELLWTVRSGGEPAVPTPAIGEGMVFASTIGPILGIKTDGRGDVTDTHVVWQQGRHRPLISSFLYVNSVLYSADNDGTFAAIDPADGEILWTRRLTGGSPDSSPIFVDGKIYVTTAEGVTTVLRPNANPRTPAEVVSVNEIGKMVQATLAVAGNQFFLRTDTELWCIGK
jgi:outer membrane protein assembly factor BamB